jgi:glutamyl-tRNA synthetase
MQEKAHFVSEFWSLGAAFFEDPTTFDEGVVLKRWKPEYADFYKRLAEVWVSNTAFTAQEAEGLFQAAAAEAGLAPNALLQLTRVMLTGLAGGPQFFEVVALLGPEVCSRRLIAFVETRKG